MKPLFRYSLGLPWQLKSHTPSDKVSCRDQRDLYCRNETLWFRFNLCQSLGTLSCSNLQSFQTVQFQFSDISPCEV